MTSTSVRMSQVLAEALRAHGTTEMFGLVGDANMLISDDAVRVAGIRLTTAQHENGAVAMADTYARLTGRVGVATVTKGPGFTNALTALMEAHKARTPLLFLVGETGSFIPDHPQLIEQGQVAAALGVQVQRYRGPEFAVTDLESAMRKALVERCPVVLSIPADHFATTVAAQPASTGLVGGAASGSVRRAGALSAADLAEVVARIERSERPVVLGGWGATLAGAEADLERLGEHAGALLASTAVAKGLFGGSEWSVGVSGGFATEIGRRLLSEADLVLAFGAAVSAWTTRRGDLYRNADIVSFNDMAGPLADGGAGTYYPSDAAVAAAQIADELASRGTRRAGFRTTELRRELDSWSARSEFTDQSGLERIDPRTLTVELDEMIPKDRIVVMDAGHNSGFPMTYMGAVRARSFLFEQYYLSVGLGLGNTAGAAVAADGRPVVSVIGDGGARMSLGELYSVRAIENPVAVIVYNDAAYGVEVHMAPKHNVETGAVTFEDTDFAGVARVMGFRGITVRTVEDLDEFKEWCADPRGHVLLDCKVDAEVKAPFIHELLSPGAWAGRKN